MNYMRNKIIYTKNGKKLIPRNKIGGIIKYDDGGKTVSDYIQEKYNDFEWIDPETIHNIGTRAYNTLTSFLIGTLSNDEKLDDYTLSIVDDRFDTAFERGWVKHKSTPEPVIQGVPHVRLYTYPPFGRYLPGHSKVEYPDLPYVNRGSNTDNYNLLFNNCSDSTNCVIKDILGDKYEWINDDIVTPEDVHQQLLKVKGAKDYVYDDVTITTVPVHNKPNHLGTREYYENATSKLLKRK